jgi:hypothetical protein
LLEVEISLERGNLGGVRALRGIVDHQKENHPPKTKIFNTKIKCETKIVNAYGTR